MDVDLKLVRLVMSGHCHPCAHCRVRFPIKRSNRTTCVPVTPMQRAGNGLKLKPAEAGGEIEPSGRPEVWAAGADSHARIVRDSSSIPIAPAAQNLRIMSFT